jgi:hypothetical protein
MKSLSVCILLICYFNLTHAQDIRTLNRINDDTSRAGGDIEYYNGLLEKAIRTRNTGMGLTLAGLGMTGLGMVIALSSNSWNGIGVGVFVFGIGGLTTLIGIPPWVTGSVKVRKNRNAIENIKTRLSFSLGPNSRGIAFQLRF